MDDRTPQPNQPDHQPNRRGLTARTTAHSSPASKAPPAGPGKPRLIDLYVAPPRCDGETIHFSWEQTAANPFQHRNQFSIRYEGIDTASYSDDLWFEIWFGLMSRILGQYDSPIRVHFPSRVSCMTIDYWRTRRGLSQHIRVPRMKPGPYSPWRGQPVLQDSREIGILYGGGKDSLAMLALAHERFGPEKLQIIRGIFPMDRGPRNTARTEDRDERLILAPAREHFGVATRRYWTDYRANLVAAHVRVTRPHIELLATAVLPLALAQGMRTLAHADGSWTMYFLQPSATGELRPVAVNTRPESYALERRHLQTVMGVDLTITNPVRPLSGAQAISLLLRRYPHLTQIMTSCVRGTSTERWCYRCTKCLLFGPVSLAEGMAVDWYDYDRAFSDDENWDRILGPAPYSQTRNAFGNVPGTRALSTPSQYVQLCDAFYRIDLDFARTKLRNKAFDRLVLLKQLFGNHPFPEVYSIPSEIEAFNKDQLTSDLLPLMREVFPPGGAIPQPYPRGNDMVIYDFTHPARPYTADAKHLRD